jgi:hypothetical protein
MKVAELLVVDSACDKSLQVPACLLGVMVSELTLETQITEHSQIVKAFIAKCRNRYSANRQVPHRIANLICYGGPFPHSQCRAQFLQSMRVGL